MALCNNWHRLVAGTAVVALAAITSPVHAQSPAHKEAPPPFDRWTGPAEKEVNARLAALAGQCRAEMELSLSYDPQDVIASIDFNLDGVPDAILDQSRVGCDGSLALWSGTGGSPVRIYVSNAAGGWDEHTTGGTFGRVELINHVPVWLSLVHGSACDGYGALPCAQVLIWGDGEFRSVADGKPVDEDMEQGDE